MANIDHPDKELIHSLTHSLFDGTPLADSTWKEICAELNKGKQPLPSELRRAHSIAVAWKHLQRAARKQESKKNREIYLDQAPPEKRLENLKGFLHNLPLEDRLILLLNDKYELSLTEIAAALGIPEDSLRLRRLSSLRTVEDWIWEDSPDLLAPNAHPKDKAVPQDPGVDHPRIKRLIEEIRSLKPISEAILPPTPAPTFKHSAQNRYRNWKQTPWFIRHSVEGGGIALVVLVIVVSIPKFQALYERHFSSGVDSFDYGALTIPEPTPPETNTAPTLPDLVKEPIAESVPQSSPALIEDAPSENSKLYVGTADIWRFIIPTDSPAEIDQKILEIVSKLEMPTDEREKITGVHAPGGIQYNFLVPKNAVADLKRQVTRLAQNSAQEQNAPSPQAKDHLKPGSEPLTWYRSRSREKLPDGMARVVIWISQI